MKFSKQYSKLSYPVFTTIRQNKEDYQAGQIINIDTPKGTFKAEILSIRELFIEDITENMAQIDADCSRQDLIDLLKSFYEENIDDLILLTLVKI